MNYKSMRTEVNSRKSSPAFLGPTQKAKHGKKKKTRYTQEKQKKTQSPVDGRNTKRKRNKKKTKENPKKTIRWRDEGRKKKKAATPLSSGVKKGKKMEKNLKKKKKKKKRTRQHAETTDVTRPARC